MGVDFSRRLLHDDGTLDRYIGSIERDEGSFETHE
jgi:hypothetical protein